MAVATYKCPNCGADLKFQPKSGDFGCEYCGAAFSEAELLEIAAREGVTGPSAADAAEEQKKQADSAGEFAEHAVLYNCPSCGAEIVTDDTTAATFCFYCHNPVILKGRLAGDFAPDRVIPFAIDRAEVKDRLVAWCKKKKFIRPDFCSDMQLEKLTGVYFPFWVVDANVRANLSAKATSLRVWRVGDIEYTETSVYALERGGEVNINDLTMKALDRADVALLAGVYPYDMSASKPFQMAYLSGFLAEKRNVERKALAGEAQQTFSDTARELIMDTTGGHGSVSVTNFAVKSAEEAWEYSLLPAWMLTYRYGGEVYYFAMNGQTGQIAGRVPVSGKKLAFLFGGVALGVALLSFVVGCML